MDEVEVEVEEEGSGDSSEWESDASVDEASGGEDAE